MSAGPAEIPRERLRRSLLRRYATDSDFAQALAALYGEHCEPLPPELAGRQDDHAGDLLMAAYGEPPTQPSRPPTFATLDIHDIDELTWRDPLTGRLDHPQSADWAAAYLAAVRALAERFGLHRLDPRSSERPFSTGESVIHTWCQMRARSGRKVDALWIVMAITYAHFIPPRDRAVVIRWDPQTETREDAQARAYRQARDALTTIDQDWRGAGLEREHDPEEERHLDWLYLKLRHGWSYGQIAEDVAAKEHVATRGMVQQALIRMADADHVDADRSGW